MPSSPICLLSKASKTKSWLWHRRLSHLNFGYINDLAKQGLVRGLPKLKYQKVHLCSACALEKSKKYTHKPKFDDSIQEKLYLLHMDLCGPMRIESISGKKYILAIVNDYSRISHQTSVACTPQQNNVVERRNYTLVEAAHLGKLKPKANIGIYVGCAPAKKAYRIYNKRTRLIMETIHVEFDELTAMAFEQFGLGPELQLMTPGTISSGLYFNPPPSVVSPVPIAAALRPVDPTGSPSSTSIDQAAPSTSTSSTIQETQSPVISEGVEEQLQLAQLIDDLFLDILTSEPCSQESSSNVQQANPPFEHISKWTKIHPLENVIGNPSRPVSTRKQLQTNAMWCFFDAFLTSIEPKKHCWNLLGLMRCKKKFMSLND
ncbi:retrovirus-related pol polyprotein from transposon TNT 1-94 [Tanacetum coccineum]